MVPYKLQEFPQKTLDGASLVETTRKGHDAGKHVLFLKGVTLGLRALSPNKVRGTLSAG